MFKLTPSDIEVLLHFYMFPEAHPRWKAPAVVSAIHYFIGEKMLVEDLKSPGERRVYHVTERGGKFIEMLCETPIPELEWIDPRSKK